MQVTSIAECSKGSILQYFWPSLSNNVPLILSFLFLSSRFTQVLLYGIYPKYSDTKELHALGGYIGPSLKLKIESCFSPISS